MYNFKSLQIFMPFDLEIPLLKTYPKEMRINTVIEVCSLQ